MAWHYLLWLYYDTVDKVLKFQKLHVHIVHVILQTMPKSYKLHYVKIVWPQDYKLELSRAHIPCTASASCSASTYIEMRAVVDRRGQ